MRIKKHIILSICFTLFAVLIYFPSFFGSLFWDDDDFIVQNTYVHSRSIIKFFTSQAVEGAGKVSNYFRPIQFSIYSFLYTYWGVNPLPYKITSVLFHTLAAISLYCFLFRLLKQPWVKINNPTFLSISISCIFLIHPIQTESISYSSGLSDPLVAVCVFLSLYSFLGYKKNTVPITSIGWYIGALLSKESGVIASGLITLLVLIQTILEIPKGNTTTKTLLLTLTKQLAPFFFITAIYLFYHTSVIHIIDMKTVWGQSPYTEHVSIRLATFFQLLPEYIYTFLLPIHLFYDRDFTVRILTHVWHLPSWMVLISTLTIGAITILHSYKQKNILPVFFYASFFISMLPFSGIILINGLLYEHYLYIPLVFLAGFFLSLLQQLASHYHINRFLITSLCVIIVLFYGIRSWIRQYEWQDPLRFYQHTLTYVPQSFRVQNNLASEYQRRRMYTDAEQAYKKAIELNPRLPNPYHNLAHLYLVIGKKDLAKEYFTKALTVDPQFFYSKIELQKLQEQ